MENTVLTIIDKVVRSCPKDAVNVVIPDGVETIDFTAFKDCEKLESVVIPDSVTVINNAAFEKCTSLKSVVIGSGVTKIPKYAFQCCTSLKKVEIPATVTEIDEYAFYECEALESVVIGSGVTKIGDHAFSGGFSSCVSLKSVVIGSSVKEIGDWAFGGCKALEQVEFDGTKSQWESVLGKDSLFSYNVPAKSVKCSDGEWKLPILLVENGVAVICFDKNVKSIVFDSDVKKISQYLFHDFSSLESVSICEGVTEIGEKAFDGCSSLKSISLPSTLQNIGLHVFDGCNAVESITSASTLFPFNEKTGKLYDATKKAKKAILSLSSEIAATEKKLAKKSKIEQVQKVSASAMLDTLLSGRTAKTTVIRNKTNSYLRIKAKTGGIEIVVPDSKLSKWLKTIPALLDLAENGADSATLRKYAYDNGFEDSSRKYLAISEDDVASWKKKTDPAYLVIPEGVTEIAKLSFLVWVWGNTPGWVVDSGCKTLESLVFPLSLKEIGERAFESCPLLSEITYCGTIEQWKAVEKDKDWCKDVPATAVKCTDGEVQL